MFQDSLSPNPVRCRVGIQMIFAARFRPSGIGANTARPYHSIGRSHQQTFPSPITQKASQSVPSPYTDCSEPNQSYRSI
ncbi:MAG TPA: hypothetical protein IGS52_20385 [Oscillatoriaceae cyanobacterium M33_DOE_052]|uniref:Uncharacterized protein n=1 Tax=Planktothricoides sp. SpSt-374 TaxID=2282167 RepID=A0A7C3ZWL9_9CYAN|nr:hypothetical protein [Oscillatoriaceae cyanobacterium M33_DOE_052]